MEVSATAQLLTQNDTSVMVCNSSKLFIHFLFPDHGKGTKEAVCPTGYKCSFDINGNGVPCGMHFKNRKELNKHKVDAKHIKKKKADGDKEGENNEVEAVAE